MVKPLVQKYLDVASVGEAWDSQWFAVTLVSSGCIGKYEVNPCGGILRNANTLRELHPSQKHGSIGYWVHLYDGYDKKYYNYDYAQLLASMFIENPKGYARAQIIDLDRPDLFDISNIGWFPDEAYRAVPRIHKKIPHLELHVNTLIRSGYTPAEILHILWPNVLAGEHPLEYSTHYNYIKRRYLKHLAEVNKEMRIKK